MCRIWSLCCPTLRALASSSSGCASALAMCSAPLSSMAHCRILPCLSSASFSSTYGRNAIWSAGSSFIVSFFLFPECIVSVITFLLFLTVWPRLAVCLHYFLLCSTLCVISSNLCSFPFFSCHPLPSLCPIPRPLSPLSLGCCGDKEAI